MNTMSMNDGSLTIRVSLDRLRPSHLQAPVVFGTLMTNLRDRLRVSDLIKPVGEFALAAIPVSLLSWMFIAF